jgi:hypothetical protein
VSGVKPAVLLVFVEVAEKDVDELNRWYDEEHGPEKLAMPGYAGLRRFRAADGSASFLAIYELSDPDAAAAPIAPSARSSQRMEEIMSRWKRWERSIWVELEPTGYSGS